MLSEKLVWLILLKVVKPSADRKMRKRLTVLVMIACFRQYGIFAKTRSRLTTVTTFCRQNDACSRARSAYLLRKSRGVLVFDFDSLMLVLLKWKLSIIGTRLC